MDDLNKANELGFPTRGTGNLIPHIEALIFASDKPLSEAEITELVNQAFGFMDNKIAAGQVDAALEGIVEKYDSEFYPFEVKHSGGGWQFLTKKEFHKTVAQLNGEKFLKRLSSAALETLAIIAYKQPITKGEIESIRGVSSDYSVQKLLEKELILITGRNEKLPGHPLVYATSKGFMDYFGINTPEDLPKIREVLTEGMVEPTLIDYTPVNHTEFEESELAVTGEGELIAAPETVSSESYINGNRDEDILQPIENENYADELSDIDSEKTEESSTSLNEDDDSRELNGEEKNSSDDNVLKGTDSEDKNPDSL
jgi:segregation and condensation protein B